MSESEALVRLQATDIELMRLHHTLDDMPQAQKLATIAKAARKLQSQLTAIIGQRKDAEMDVAENQRKHEETLAKIQTVQAEAAQRQASFREARDVEAHLTALAKQQEKLEHAYIEKAETLDKLTRAEKNARDLGTKLAAEACIASTTSRAATITTRRAPTRRRSSSAPASGAMRGSRSIAHRRMTAHQFPSIACTTASSSAAPRSPSARTATVSS